MDVLNISTHRDLISGVSFGRAFTRVRSRVNTNRKTPFLNLGWNGDKDSRA